MLTIVLCSLIAILDVVNDERNEKYNAIFSFNTFVDSSEQLTNLALGITTFVYVWM